MDGKPISEGMEKFGVEWTALDLLARDGKVDLSKIQIRRHHRQSREGQIPSSAEVARAISRNVAAQITIVPMPQEPAAKQAAPPAQDDVREHFSPSKKAVEARRHELIKELPSARRKPRSRLFSTKSWPGSVT